jgi:hypothetical protein
VAHHGSDGTDTPVSTGTDADTDIAVGILGGGWPDGADASEKTAWLELAALEGGGRTEIQVVAPWLLAISATEAEGDFAGIDCDDGGWVGKGWVTMFDSVTAGLVSCAPGKVWNSALWTPLGAVPMDS